MDEPSAKFSVYEVVNHDLRELVVGLSTLDGLAEIKRSHKPHPPVWMARWKPEHSVEYKLVESELSRKAAAAFAKTYTKASAWASYKVYITG